MKPTTNDDDDEILIAGMLTRSTARELAEELVHRCACSFIHDADERVWDDDDVKHVYDINPSPDDSQAVVKEKLMRAFDAITEAGAKQFGGEIFRIAVRGHAKKAIKILARQPWAHTKEIPLPKTSARIH